MKLNDYKEKYTEDDAPGWLAIDEVVKKLYPDQEPKHWAAAPHYAVGGTDPIDGISFYQANWKGESYYHFVTYGFSNLYYNEECIEDDFSKFGFELTFRLKPFSLDKGNPSWVFQLIQNIARYAFDSGKWFEPGHYMPANGPIRLTSDTQITGVAFALDPELGEIDTPHGHLQFLQMYGITEAEFSDLKESGGSAEDLIEGAKQSNPLLITDLERIG